MILLSIITLFFVSWIFSLKVTPKVIKTKFLPSCVDGIALLPGLVIINEKSFYEYVIRHELVHQVQMQRYSPFLFYFLITTFYLWGFMKILWTPWRTCISNATWDNFLEREARDKMYGDNKPFVISNNFYYDMFNYGEYVIRGWNYNRFNKEVEPILYKINETLNDSCFDNHFNLYSYNYFVKVEKYDDKDVKKMMLKLKEIK
jgi:hypothetical protein